ncbi:MAG: hypothetical protein GY748_18560 [Planctomycetaceae bacterium]|nr:hypothetical protein [Planctomycetaceae bacterium]
MKISFAFGFALFVFFPGVVQAQTWTTPDGFLSIAQPNSDQFSAVSDPPKPFIGLWVAKDESARIGVMKTQIPAGVKLLQAAVEKGLAEEVGGKVTRLATRQVAGYQVWCMKAKSASVEITQALVRHNDTLYKLMGVTSGSERDEQVVLRIVDSLAILKPAEAGESARTVSPSQPNRANDGGTDLHKLSKSIGGYAALLGIGLLIYFLMRGKK